MRNTHVLALATALVLLFGPLSGCKKQQTGSNTGTTANADPKPADPKPADPKPADTDKAEEKVEGSVVELDTSMGKIKIELNREKAPKSVNNFLRYVKDGHYNGTIFHRVISGFMVQGGGFTPDFTKKPTRAPIQNEADNGLLNERGTVAMARTSMPHSATAQFFVNVVDNTFLNHSSKTMRGWGYTVFGKVIEGMDVVDKIRNTPTGAKGPFRKDCPQTAVVIKSAKIIE